MPDDIDAAQERDAEFRRDALEALRRKGTEGRVRVKDGRRVCTDCGEKIPPARLRRIPTALRCTPCQEDIEANLRNYHRV